MVAFSKIRILQAFVDVYWDVVLVRLVGCCQFLYEYWVYWSTIQRERKVRDGVGTTNLGCEVVIRVDSGASKLHCDVPSIVLTIMVGGIGPCLLWNSLG